MEKLSLSMKPFIIDNTMTGAGSSFALANILDESNCIIITPTKIASESIVKRAFKDVGKKEPRVHTLHDIKLKKNQHLLCNKSKVVVLWQIYGAHKMFTPPYQMIKVPSELNQIIKNTDSIYIKL